MALPVPRLRRLAAALALIGLAAGAATVPAAPAGAAGSASTAGAAGHRPALTESRPCAEAADFTCSVLTVPLDRSGRLPGSLRLNVAVAGNADAPRGTLLFLTGGPGQPGVSFVPRIRERVAYLLDDYRLVMVDQRGTGPAGIDCPKLQAEVGSSDITPPSPGAVQECADLIGPARNHYTTADTVADLDDLRAALGVSRWTIDGISYGAFVGIRYGLTHPLRVKRLVLDSVVPQRGIPALYTEGLRRVEYVLRTACAEQACGYDPVAELAEVVRRYGNGVGVFDFLVIASIVDPKLTGETFYPVLLFLHLAAQGVPEPLDAAIADLQGGETTPYAQFSSGLHAATLCADSDDFPWGGPRAPLSVREAAVRRTVAALPASATYPFPTSVAGEHGVIATCRAWPPARPNPAPPMPRLVMPVLLLAGDRDLSTPLDWAREQARLTPRGKLVVVEGMGHSIQGRNADGDAAVRAFLLA